MARPIKNYCDYFPHDRDMRNHRKVKAIRTKFNIQGYAIWSMILEYLTGIDGNVFEYSDVEFELMGGDFGVSATEIRNVVDYCITLEMLFLEKGFIRSESLDERLKPVYEKRQVSKEISKKQQRIDGKFAPNNTDTNGVSVTVMPQSKVKEIKVKKNKEGYNKEELVLPFSSSEFNICWEDWIEYKKTQHKFEYKALKTEQAALASLAKLSGYLEKAAIEIIMQSISNGWQGFFALKEQPKPMNNKFAHTTPTPQVSSYKSADQIIKERGL